MVAALNDRTSVLPEQTLLSCLLLIVNVTPSLSIYGVIQYWTYFARSLNAANHITPSKELSQGGAMAVAHFALFN